MRLVTPRAEVGQQDDRQRRQVDVARRAGAGCAPGPRCWASRKPCVRTAALGWPVLPLVKVSSAGVVRLARRRSRHAGGSGRSRDQRVAPGTGQPMTNLTGMRRSAGDQQPQQVRLRAGDQAAQAGAGTAALDVLAARRRVEEHGHQPQPEQRQQGDVQLGGHRGGTPAPRRRAAARAARAGRRPGWGRPARRRSSAGRGPAGCRSPPGRRAGCGLVRGGSRPGSSGDETFDRTTARNGGLKGLSQVDRVGKGFAFLLADPTPPESNTSNDRRATPCRIALSPHPNGAECPCSRSGPYRGACPWRSRRWPSGPGGRPGQVRPGRRRGGRRLRRQGPRRLRHRPALPRRTSGPSWSATTRWPGSSSGRVRAPRHVGRRRPQHGAAPASSSVATSPPASRSSSSWPPGRTATT